MVGRMSGRRQESDVVIERVIAADQLGLFRFDDRQDAVGDASDRGLGMLLDPVGVFPLREQIACVRKRRHPSPILEPRIPADVIEMQMRAQYEIDIVNRQTCRRQGTHVGLITFHVHGRKRVPVLVVADAAVDQDRMVRRAHDVRLKAKDQLPLWSKRTRNQPGPMFFQDIWLQAR